MKIVNLVAPDDRRALKKGKSYMGEYTCLRGSGSKILAPHKRKIRAWRTKCNAIAFVVSPHTGKTVAPCNVTLEVVNA
jgi:hypothetical protein